MESLQAIFLRALASKALLLTRLTVHKVSTQTIEALRATLTQIEQIKDLTADDPSLSTLKSILLQRIAEIQAVDEVSAQRAEQEALEVALRASTAPENDAAATLAIDLAVSLLASNPAGRPFEPSAKLPVDPLVAVPDLPPLVAAPVQNLPEIVNDATPGDLPPSAS